MIEIQSADLLFPEIVLHTPVSLTKLGEERRLDLADNDEAIEAGFFEGGNCGGFIRLNGSTE
jgi:hypothetical protein